MGDVEDVDSIDINQQSTAIQWTLASPSINDLPSSRVMLLPAHINHTGPARVDQFMPSEPHLEPMLQFRGRDMKAEKIELSDNMIGLVVKQSTDQLDQPEFTVTNQFSSLYLLHRDPSMNDRADVRNAIVNWPKFAHALHSD